MTPGLQFTNVPEAVDLALSKESLCEGCEKPNLTPFYGRTCDHILCGSCWQKSACDLGEQENKCLVCKTPTDLLCYRDYNKFIGSNLYRGELRPDTLGAEVKLLKTHNAEAVAKAMDALEQHHKEMFRLLLNECAANRVKRVQREAWIRENSTKGNKRQKKEV
jgi:hypothetical protein